MTTYTTNKNLYKWNATDTKQTTIQEMSTTMDTIDSELAKTGDLTTLKTSSKSNLAGAINELDNEIGDLTTLSTEDKTSLVNAINETFSSKASTASIGDLTKLNTTHKDSLVNAINDNTSNLASNANDSLWRGLNAKIPMGTNLTPCKADGVTDDQSALQAIVNYMDSIGGGTIFLPPGKYKLSSPITWKTNVSLIGSGVGISVIIPYGVGFSAIYGIGSLNNTYDDCTFKDFEIDCSNLGDSSKPYNVSEKGMYIQYMLRPKFINVYIHDAPATGFGCDFLQDALFSGCVANNCGRLFGINGGSLIGGSGIGIGTGVWEYENIYIIGCTANNNGNFGIFVEYQLGTSTYYSRGTHIMACTANNNGQSGICDKGVDELKVIGCRMEDNTNDGFQIVDAAIGGLFEGNTVRGNGQYGVHFYANTVQGFYTIRGNKIYNNTKHGVVVPYDIPNISILENEIYNNGAVGIELNGSATDINVSNNDIYNNGIGAISGYQQAILIESNLVRPKINNNRCYDNQPTKTQSYGIQLSSGFIITNGTINDNNLDNNSEGAMHLAGTLTTTPIQRNEGYNNGNTVTTLTASGSPWTYTAGPTPETIYLTGTGISVHFNSIAITSGQNYVNVTLYPFQSVTIVYTTMTSAYSLNT